MNAISSIDACIASVCSGLQLSLMTWYLPLIFGILHWTPLQRMIGPWDLGLRPTSLRECVLFIGTQFSNLYTAVDTSQLVWGSVFLENLSHFSLIPSRLTNAISSTHERHLRKPQDESYSNQYLQELRGKTTASLSSAIYMADSSSSNK
jgi:hypothetical protein